MAELAGNENRERRQRHERLPEHDGFSSTANLDRRKFVAMKTSGQITVLQYRKANVMTRNWLKRFMLALIPVLCCCLPHITDAQTPSIIIQPVGQSSAVGGTIQFTVSATGGGTLAYQWRKNATNLTNGTFSGRATVSGATTTAMTLAGVTTNDQANYTCYITNTSGSITSSVATLAIILPPTITTQPKSVATNVGATVSFSVVASGTAPLNYQWYDNGTNISGATLNAYTISGVFTSDSGIYTVRVSNGAGATTSSNAVLAIGNSPVLTLQPSSLVVTQGQTASFSASVSGDQPMYYFWRKNGINIAGETNSSFAIASTVPTNAATYTFVASNSIGTATSTGAVLTVYYPPTITVQPVSQSVGVGSNFTVSVTATGNPALAYQWRTNGTAIPGATSSSYTVTGAQPSNSGIYDVIVSNLVNSLTSSGALVSVIYYPPTITAQPVGGNILAGNSYSLNASAVGTAPLSWQWRKNGTPIPGANSNSYIFNPTQLTDAGFYDAVVTNVVGTVTSSVATIYAGYAPVITQQPVSMTNAFGSTVVFSCNATGPLPMNYQWFQNSTNLLGQTNATLTLTNLQLQNVGNFLVVVGDAFGSITSSVAVLHISPGMLLQPTNQIVMPGSQSSFSALANGEPTLTYQWQLNGTNLTDNSIYSGSTSTNLYLTAALANTVGNYSLVVSDSYGSITSAVANLSFGFNANSTFNYSGMVQPYIVPAGVTQLWVAIRGGSGANGTAGSAPGSGGLGGYACGIISVIPSNTLTLSVGGGGNGINGGFSPLSGYSGGNDSFTGGAGGAATVIVMPDGGNIICGGGGGGGGSDLWSFSGDFGGGGGSSILVGATNSQTSGGGGGGGAGGGGAIAGNAGGNYGGLGYASGGNGGSVGGNGGYGGGGAGGSFLPLVYLYPSYTWQFTNLPNTGLNGFISVVANPIPYIGQQPITQSALAGAATAFNVVATSPVPLFYQWSKDGFGISNATNSTFSLAAITPQYGGNYSVVVSNIYASVTSSVAILTVDIPVYITSQPQSQTVLQGGNAGFTVAATGTPPLEYQWQKNGSNLPAATLPTYSIPSASITDAGYYLVIITNAYGSVTSSIVSLGVTLPPQRLNISSSGRDGVQLQMSGTPNFAYAVQSATNLTPPIQWQSLLTNTADTNGVWQFTDTNLNSAQKFYRVTTP